MIKICNKILSLILISFVTILLTISGHTVPRFFFMPQDRIDWDELLVAFKAVEKDPSQENIIKFLSLIPEKYTEDQKGDEEKFLMAINGREKYEELLLAGNLYVVEATFRLMAYVEPGAYYEDFFISLGQLATKHPRLFLQMLTKYKDNFRYEYPVTMTEILDIVPDIVTEEDARRRDEEELKLYEKRLKALKSVTDEELLEIRDKCIAEIEKNIKEIKERMKGKRKFIRIHIGH